VQEVMMDILLINPYRFINIISSKVKKPYSMLFYAIESGNWSIKWNGKYITENLNNQKLLKGLSKGLFILILTLINRRNVFNELEK
jgi:hypothetical protein